MNPADDARDLTPRKAPIDIDTETFRKNGYLLIDKIAELLSSFPERKVTRGEQPREIKSFLGNDSLPQEGTSPESILSEASALLFDHSLFNGHPRFWGYITSSPAPGGILADLLASGVNANVGAYILSPMATEMERQAVRWIAQLIGYHQDCGGLFVSGGNMANFIGVLAARKAKATWDIRKAGLGDNNMMLYCSKATHTWIHKAADLFGFGTNNIRWIEVNEQQQMNTQALEEQIVADRKSGYLPFVVVGTAGSVSTGVVDPLDEISTLCKKYNLWFHIDGAYGAPAAAVPDMKSLFKGLENADSIALDPHKWLYSPLEAGCILVKNERMLTDTFSFHPDYYNFDGKGDDPVVNFHEAGFQNSRGFRALKVWVTLKQVGRAGYVKMIRDDITLAKYLFELAGKHAELASLSQHLSIATFRYIPAEFDKTSGDDYLNKLNEEIVNRIQTEGEVFLSNAIIDKKYCLRVCIVNFRTSHEDIKALVEIVVRTGRVVHREWSSNRKNMIL